MHLKCLRVTGDVPLLGLLILRVLRGKWVRVYCYSWVDVPGPIPRTVLEPASTCVLPLMGTT